jgi:hypothetical protein
MVPENYIEKAIHAHMGQAIEAYSRVEQIQVQLLAVVLRLEYKMAAAIFYSVQNVRSRNEMIQTLLTLKYGEKYKEFWDSCTAFLSKLSVFRNAIVHWHPITIIALFSGDRDYGLKNTSPLKQTRTLEAKDFPAFIGDCSYITMEIETFMWMLRGDAPQQQPSWQEKFSQPITRQNQADLRPPPKPKAPKRPRKPSRASRRIKKQV